jgi:hypothetical protein
MTYNDKLLVVAKYINDRIQDRDNWDMAKRQAEQILMSLGITKEVK